MTDKIDTSAVAYEAAARVCDDKAGDALIAAQEAQDRHDLRDCVLLEDRAATLIDAGASIRALAIAAAIRAETEEE